MKTSIRDSIWKTAELWVLAQIMRRAPIPTLQEPVRQNIFIVLKTLLPAETSAPKRTKKDDTAPKKHWRSSDAISVLRIVIAKPNRFAAVVTIIFVRTLLHSPLRVQPSLHSAENLYTNECKLLLCEKCERKQYSWLDYMYTLL